MVGVARSVVLEGHHGIVWCVSWSNSGDVLASCGEDRFIKFWGVRDGVWHCIRSLETTHERTIRSIRWSPCDQFIASCGFDGRISVWKEDQEVAVVLEGRGSEVKSIDWSPDGLLLASCFRDKSVWIWERESDGEFQSVSILNYHTQDVKRVKWHPTSQELFSTSYDNTVRSYAYSRDVDDWACNFNSALHQSTVWGIDFNAAGDKMVTCSADKTVRLWGKRKVVEADEGAPLWECLQCISGVHEQAVYDVSWCKKSSSIATACGDNAIRIFSKSEAGDAYELEQDMKNAHHQDVNCVSWSPSEEGLLASCGDDGLVKLWFLSS